MRVRQPQFDFSRARAHWAPNREFAHLVNGMSVGVPPLERFLNRVMARARKEIKGDDPASVQLRADITTFIRQESCHYAIHDDMNAMLKRDGYEEGIAAIEAAAEAHYARLLKTRSLAFLVAYCEGFETIGPVAAMSWCNDTYDALLKGGDPNVVMMWKWHMMEEYEHRNVCYDVFQAVHGGYFLRIYAFFYQMYCLRKYSGQVTRYMLSVDRAKMSPEALAASIASQKALKKGMRGKFFQKFGKVLLPWYRPHMIPTPVQFGKVEMEIDRDWTPAKASALHAAGR